MAGLMLAILGISGVMSYSVARRVREMGLRMAVGADPSEVLGLIVREGVVLTMLGLGLGMVAAGILGRLLDALLFQVTAHDPVVFLSTGVVVLCIGVVSSFLPALRASRVNPVEALSFE